MKELSAVITIAYRDVLKFLRDRARIIATFIFPVLFIGALGGSLQSNLGRQLQFNYLAFVFTGVIAQTVFQSAASGIISLVEDKENDFSQEIFVSPISRYSIILGKILGESTVAMIQGLGVVLFALIIQVPIPLYQLLLMAPVSLIVSVFGGAFGVLVMSQLNSQRAVNQVFPFLMLPQFFLSGVFSPMKDLPIYLLIPSRIVPMTYAVDFIRSLFYIGRPEYAKVVIYSPVIDFTIILVLFIIFLFFGTWAFVRRERNR